MLFTKPRRKALGFSRRDIRRVPYSGQGRGGTLALDVCSNLC